MIKCKADIEKGLEIIRKRLINISDGSDPFLNEDALIEVVDLLDNYVSTHKVEINNYLNKREGFGDD